jgi:isopenicillin N synthase-like dioxygenase
MNRPTIPRIDVSPLFEDNVARHTAVDRAIYDAAATAGFLVITGLPDWASLDDAKRKKLLQLFSLPEAEIRKLWLWNFDHNQKNVYRGWFPLQNGHPTYKQGIDIGPDLIHGTGAVQSNDPLLSATPFPPEDLLPGWRDAARAYYSAMVKMCAAIMGSIARGLGLPDTTFDEAFEGGISTLRLIHYPIGPEHSFAGAADEEMWTVHDGERRYLTGRPHADTGFLTVLAQNGVSGLQAKHRDGSWIDIPPEDGTLAVNFGKVLERWTAGRVRATVHRVLGSGQERYSIPFFYEPRPDAVIAPLPLPEGEVFQPFYYGDHLWETITKHNVEFRGIGHLRKPLGTPTSQQRTGRLLRR